MGCGGDLPIYRLRTRRFLMWSLLNGIHDETSSGEKNKGKQSFSLHFCCCNFAFSSMINTSHSYEKFSLGLRTCRSPWLCRILTAVRVASQGRVSSAPPSAAATLDQLVCGQDTKNTHGENTETGVV